MFGFSLKYLQEISSKLEELEKIGFGVRADIVNIGCNGYYLKLAITDEHGKNRITANLDEIFILDSGDMVIFDSEKDKLYATLELKEVEKYKDGSSGVEVLPLRLPTKGNQ